MNKQMDILKYVFQFLILIVALLFILGELFLPRETVNEIRCEQFNVPWTMIREDGSTSEITIPGNYDVARNEKIYIETIIPENLEENLYLCFRTNRQDIAIYVDDELRQQYSTLQSKPYGHSSTSAFVFLRLESGDMGRPLRVSFQTDTAYSGKFQAIYYGDKMGIWGFWLKERGAELFASLLLLLMGVICVLGCLVLRFCYQRPLELIYLGWGVVLAACWMISDSIFRQLCFPNISIVNDLAFVMVMLMPYPFLIYLNELQNRRYNVFYVIVCSLIAVDAIVCISLQFLNLVDFADSIKVFGAFSGIAVLLLGITIMADCIKGYIRQYRLAAIGMLGAAAAGITQLVVYFRRNASSSGVMIAYGMIFLLVISSINTIRDILLSEKEKQQAIMANKAKAQFLANMSHEIRTPINAVLGMDEIILRECTEPNIKEYAMDIRNAGKSLLALINDILDFSKIESGKLELVPVEYELSSLISDCYNMISMKAQEKQLELFVENDPALPNRLYGDEVRIRQVIVNLLTNAVKYTKAGFIRLSIQGQRLQGAELLLQIQVQDSGIGITEENCAKLFDSFQRVDEQRNRNIEGTGLGLAISKQIVELMDGSITVKSEYGKGSVFNVEIIQGIIKDCPVGEFSAKANHITQEDCNQTLSLIAPDGKILVVDDVDMNLKVFTGLLRQTQLQIDTALSGREALEMAGRHKYHIIFLDHMMPEMDGIETFRALKQMKAGPNIDTPVIMLTANAIAGAQEDYLQEGFADYLSKPIQSDCLEEMIRKYLPPSCIVHDEEPHHPQYSEKDNETSTTNHLSRPDFLDWKTGLMYCGDSEDFYLEMLKTYIASDRTSILKQYYSQQDWENYRIQVHSLKSTSLSIGAVDLSEHAKAMELALKEQRLDYVHEKHTILIDEYQEILNQLINHEER